MSSANPPAFYVDGQEDEESENEEDAVADPDGDVSDVAVDRPPQQAPPPQPRRRRYQRGPLAIHQRRTCVFASLGLQLAKTPFSALSKKGRPIGRG
jgi:hypothetical protein